MVVVNLNLGLGQRSEPILGCIIECCNDKQFKLYVPNDGVFQELITSYNVANTFYNILLGIEEINQVPYCSYGTVKNCLYFARSPINIRESINQHQAFWLFLQKTGLKIQLSMTFRNQFENYYLNNIELFQQFMNTEGKTFKQLMEEKDGSKKIKANYISRYSNERVKDWINFNLVDTDPLPLLFGFFESIEILLPV